MRFLVGRRLDSTRWHLRVQDPVDSGTLADSALRGFSRCACVASARPCGCRSPRVVCVRQPRGVRAAQSDRLYACRTSSWVKARSPRASAGSCAVAQCTHPAEIRAGEVGFRVQDRDLSRCIPVTFLCPPSMSAHSLRQVMGHSAFTPPWSGRKHLQMDRVVLPVPFGVGALPELRHLLITVGRKRC